MILNAIHNTGFSTNGVEHKVSIDNLENVCLTGRRVSFKTPNQRGSSLWLHNGCSGEAVITGITKFPMRGVWCLSVTFLTDIKNYYGKKTTGWLKFEHCELI